MATGYKDYVFVKEGTEYAVPSYDKNKIKVTESSEARKRLMNLYYFKKKTKKQKTKLIHLQSNSVPVP